MGGAVKEWAGQSKSGRGSKGVGGAVRVGGAVKEWVGRQCQLGNTEVCECVTDMYPVCCDFVLADLPPYLLPGLRCSTLL